MNANLKKGFTLVELLTVIAIIGILVAILIPATQSLRASARRTSCQNNMRQLLIAMTEFETTNDGFPPADNGRGGSMWVELLPSLDQKALLKKATDDLEPGETYAERMAELASFQIDVLFCPSSTSEHRSVNETDQGQYAADYFGITGPIGNATSSDGDETYTYQSVDPVPSGGNVGLNGMFAPDDRGKFTIIRGTKDALDGIANTLALGEISRFTFNSSGAPISRAGWSFGASYSTAEELENVYAAKSIEYSVNSAKGVINNLSFASSHPGGANFAFVDSTVKFVKDDIDVDILKTLASTNSLEQPERLDGQ